jgi:hypothetical protein
MQIEVSTGEVVDKWTILSIKALKIQDKEKLVNVFKERSYLTEMIPPEIIHDAMTNELLKVNKNLWDVEDRLRNCERDRLFDEHFVQLARSVYRLNDKRAKIKKEINLKYGSDFVEEKSYRPY